MAIAPSAFDPVPQATAGIFSTRCECGWEAVHILPEEQDQRLAAIITHIESYHGALRPLLTVTSH